MTPPPSAESRSTAASAALRAALDKAAALEARRAHAEAARLLDEAGTAHPEAPAALRFQALLLRTDLAISLNELVEGRGILAEARQVRLTAEERGTLAADLARAEDLEAFFTHRGCAG
jgi:hypothetical protein